MKLKQVRASSIIPLHILNWWDGPLSGICVYRGKPFFFSNKGDAGQDIYDVRRYKLHSMTDEQMKIEEEHNRDWKKWVGTHTDFNPDWTRKDGEVLSSETHHLFYDKWGKDCKNSQRTPLDSVPATKFFILGNLKAEKRKYREYQRFDKAWTKKEKRKLIS